MTEERRQVVPRLPPRPRTAPSATPLPRPRATRLPARRRSRRAPLVVSPYSTSGKPAKGTLTTAARTRSSTAPSIRTSPPLKLLPHNPSRSASTSAPSAQPAQRVAHVRAPAPTGRSAGGVRRRSPEPPVVVEQHGAPCVADRLGERRQAHLLHRREPVGHHHPRHRGGGVGEVQHAPQRRAPTRRELDRFLHVISLADARRCARPTGRCRCARRGATRTADRSAARHLPQRMLSEMVGCVERETTLRRRAALHAALGDPIRLAIVDELTVSDRSPTRAAPPRRHRVEPARTPPGRAGRGRPDRTVALERRRPSPLRPPAARRPRPPGAGPTRRHRPALFLCTANSARSQLAAALWQELTGTAADSAGTHPAERVHPGAVAAARRAGLDLVGCRATGRGRRGRIGDAGRHRLRPRPRGARRAIAPRLHWSIPDPVPIGTAAAFDATLAELRERTAALLEAAGLAS